jgi:hypothetical protein
MTNVPSIALAQLDAVLVLDPEEPADSHATRWRLIRGLHERAVRIRLSQLGEWVMVPQPATDAERRRAAAQLAIPLLAAAMAAATFFAPGQDEHLVVIDTFHPQMSPTHQLPWSPALTPYLPEWPFSRASSRGQRTAGRRHRREFLMRVVGGSR